MGGAKVGANTAACVGATTMGAAAGRAASTLGDELAAGKSKLKTVTYPGHNQSACAEQSNPS
ncbi:MAG: hypothetical protein HC853_14095 [Anaerolineae bacterium]|nr:hypothetical protein [Anaerolineae bacterium]